MFGKNRRRRCALLLCAATAVTGVALAAPATAAPATVSAQSTRAAATPTSSLDAAAVRSNVFAVRTCRTATTAAMNLYWAQLAARMAATTQSKADDGVARSRMLTARSAADRTGAICRAARQKAVADRTAAQAAHRILDRYGIYPLPISESEATGYGLSASDIRGVVEAHTWAAGDKPRYIRQRESGGDYSINTGNGYYGAYQFDYSSWLANGGGRFARTANAAPAWAQDFVAWTYWRRAGWGPWGG